MKSRKNREQYKRAIIFLISFLLLVVLVALFGLIWYRSYAGIIIQPFFRKGNWLVIGVYALLLYIFTRLYGGYRIGYFKRAEVIYSAVLSTLMVNTVTYLQISLIGRRFMDLRPLAAMSVCDMGVIILWALTADKAYRKIFPPHKMLLVYGGRSAEKLILKMNTRFDKYDICQAIHISEGLEYIFSCIDRFEAVVICDVKAETRNCILKYCYARSIRAYLTPKISDTIIRGADVIHLFDTPLLLCSGQGLTFEQRFAKRLLDITASLIALALLWPFMLLIAAAIRLYDGGPILYRQTRLTLEGKSFQLYKFRSMRVNAEQESGPRLAQRNDDRITPVGVLIRRFRLDELPQMLNILKGDMSLVGPRPERPEIAEMLESVMPEFAFRLKVKAGLTGYAQVMGKYNTEAYDKLKLDLMYIEQYSLLLDLRLLLMTIKIIFLPGSTEGVENDCLCSSSERSRK